MVDNENKSLRHIGIIMDGNGRWAKERGLSRSMGHREGSKTLEVLAKYIFNKGIPYLSIYAFSTENFKRDKEEVDFLMDLFIEMFTKGYKDLKKNGIKIVFSGRKENLRKDVLASMEKITRETEGNTKGILNICLNYGGQLEIVDMVKKISTEVVNKTIKIEDIDLELVSHFMYQELPPLDFVIRTSGEIRTSNFMLWQSSYAEYYFPKTYFPDFKEKEFDLALEEYYKRNRRFGGTKK